MSDLLLRDVELNAKHTVDVRVKGGQVVETGHLLTRRVGEPVVHGHGAALLPGLADHHIHLYALAASENSVDLTSANPVTVGERLRKAVAGDDGWIRAVGYDDVVHGTLDRDVLDRWVARVPVRVQHRSGALWIVNSAGVRLLGAESAAHSGIERDDTGRTTGRLWRSDGWLRNVLGTRPLSLRAVGRRLASYGVTHVADATPDSGGTVGLLIAAAIERGELPQHVAVMGTGIDHHTHARITLGPVKLLVTDHQMPGLDELTDSIRQAHNLGRPAAVHCVTRPALALTLAALEASGVREGDRVEHCAVTDVAAAEVLAERGVRVVTQPTLVTRRGDAYWQRTEPEDRQDLWRYASLLRAGVRVAPSSDAPYGDLDPWACLTAAAHRRTPSGRVLGPDERVPSRVALCGMLSRLDDPGGTPRRVRPGARADLVLLDRPLGDALRRPETACVRTTIIDGETVFEREE